AASPLARYGAIENALTSGFATADLHHSAGHDLPFNSSTTDTMPDQLHRQGWR
ncbi:hypothetical protein FHX16_003555, partial [Rhizobium sp. BK661]|nr:hypothetical protein [Rhizobium sp. BK661]